MMKSNQHVLVIFIEPTPYILGFLREVEAKWPGTMDVIFLKENHTQSWNLTLPVSCAIVSAPPIKTIILIRQQINKKRYAIVHIAGWGNLVCLFMFFFARLKRIPLSVESDTQLSTRIPRWKRAVKYGLYQRPLYPILFKLPSIFLPGGTRQAKYLQYYGVTLEKIVLAQMTVDIKGLQQKISNINPEERQVFRQQYHTQQDDVVFLYVGRLLDWKGIRELIEAFNSLNILHVRLWIVGDGGLDDHVNECAQQYPNIQYFGRESGDRLVSIYHAADIFVLPSVAEPWGLVVNEAMAAGNAIIASDNAGCVDDLIIHNKTGLLVPPEDMQALRNAMLQLARSADLRKKLQEQAKVLISTWTLENEANNVVRAWKHILTNETLS